MTDFDWMMRALELARRGRGLVEPNPMVGAVVLSHGAIVGEGWHQRFGEVHAEVNALNQAGASAVGATLYVTLEPCNHTGKTPPCVDAIIRAGVRKVVAAMTDPFPQVAGSGIARLRAAGIDVDVGIGEAEAKRLNGAYLTLVSMGRPYVHAKWAMTLDGKIATHSGQSKWITGQESRRRVHELRGLMDAIIVGAGTVRADDPQLTARPPGPRTALRVVLSSEGRLPENCQLLRSAHEVPVLIAGARIATPSHFQALGCEVLAVNSVADLLAEFGRRRFTNVLVEGGGGVLGSFRDAGLIDEVHAFIAAKLIGGKNALSPLGGIGAETTERGLNIVEWTCERVADDIYINGRISPDSK